MSQLTYYIKTYGCAMNYADSNAIRNVLQAKDYSEVISPLKADIIILNSCSIRKQAEDKVAGWILRIKDKKYKDKKYILTGCMAVRYKRSVENFKNDGKSPNIDDEWEIDQKYVENLYKKHKWIDLILSIRDIENLPEYIEKYLLKGKRPPFSDKKLSTPESLNVICKNILTNEFQALIPISSGCNNFCTYCIVPYTRSRQNDYKYDIILSRVKEAISQGYKQITLLGQNINSWRDVSEGKDYDFADLLESLSKIEGEFWINFLSSNPMDWTDKLTNIVINSKKVMKWLNLAVQSGSNDVLKRMNRRYSVERFYEIVSSLKEKMPKFRVYTDAIIGFSGETEDDFKKTMNLIKKAKIEMVYTGKYSVRQGTTASKLFKDDVSLRDKIFREKMLVNYINEFRARENKKLIGKNMKILIKSVNKGITFFNHDVVFKGRMISSDLLGCFVDCLVVDANVRGLVVKLN